MYILKYNNSIPSNQEIGPFLITNINGLRAQLDEIATRDTTSVFYVVFTKEETDELFKHIREAARPLRGDISERELVQIIRTIMSGDTSLPYFPQWIMPTQKSSHKMFGFWFNFKTS